MKAKLIWAAHLGELIARFNFKALGRHLLGDRGHKLTFIVLAVAVVFLITLCALDAKWHLETLEIALRVSWSAVPINNNRKKKLQNIFSMKTSLSKYANRITL